MKKNTIYLLLMTAVVLGFAAACNNDKEFYTYVTPDTSSDEEPYELTFSVKMTADDLARISSGTGTLTGVTLSTTETTGTSTSTSTGESAAEESTTRADDTNTATFTLTKNTTNNSMDATIKVMATVRGETNVLTVKLTHVNGSTTTLTEDVTSKLTTLNHLTAETQITLLGDTTVALPGAATDIVGGTDVTDWSGSNGGSGEAGREFDE